MSLPATKDRYELTLIKERQTPDRDLSENFLVDETGSGGQNPIP